MRPVSAPELKGPSATVFWRSTQLKIRSVLQHSELHWTPFRQRELQNRPK